MVNTTNVNLEPMPAFSGGRASRLGQSLTINVNGANGYDTKMSHLFVGLFNVSSILYVST